MPYKYKHIYAVPAIIGISIGIVLAFLPLIGRFIAIT
jgi:hypothetical protein